MKWHSCSLACFRKSCLIKLCPGGTLNKGGDAPRRCETGECETNFEDADAFVGMVTATHLAALQAEEPLSGAVMGGVLAPHRVLSSWPWQSTEVPGSLGHGCDCWKPEECFQSCGASVCLRTVGAPSCL